MIIDEITFCDFGVFRGHQSARLTPPSSTRPIALFGGLNGAGKTTLLEGLQLALYGRHAPFLGSPRRYDAYLEASIHRFGKARDGASVGLVFRVNEDGRERAYEVSRSWRRVKARTAEDVQVNVDGEYDRVLSEGWFEHAERFIPARLSPLFFFDGERIEALADPSRSAEVLETAIHTLLGVDLVERLRIDLEVLSQRKQKEVKSRVDRKQIDALERELKTHNERLLGLKQTSGQLQNERDRADKRLRRIESDFISQGGRLGDERRDLEKRRDETLGELRAARAHLVHVAAGAMPLTLIAKLLRQALTQAEAEERSNRAAALAEVSAERDAKLIQHLKQAQAEPRTIKAAQQFLRGDRRALDAQSRGERYLDLPDENTEQLRGLLGTRLSEVTHQARTLIEQYEALEASVDELDRSLASIPDEESLADLLAQLQQAREEFAQRERELNDSQQLVRHASADRDRIQNERESLLRKGRESEFENQDIARHIRHSERIRDSLDQFRVALVAKHATRLQDLIRDGFLQLLRKRSLVSRVEIDPDSCALNLSNGNGKRIPEDRLSAGERQLLAVSMLWGLAKASGRPLPTLIDTPLGRLDATHRSNLVERYFPCASHQVILLSTDEEIDERYYEQLRGRVGHTYTLEYDDRSKSSAIVPGYFW